MQEQVVIFLPSDPLDNPSWVLLDANGKTIDTIIEGSLANLTDSTVGRLVSAIAPAESMMLTQVNMPKMDAKRLLKAIPYAIEENLIDDVESLHIAIGPQAPSGDVAVAIVSKALMQQWLALLANWGVSAKRLLPLTLTLPLSTNTWTLACLDYLYARTGQYAGFTCDLNNAKTYMNAALATDHPPSHIQIFKTSDSTFASQWDVAASINEKVMKQEQWCALLAENSFTDLSLNLLQGSFATQRESFLAASGLKRWTYYLALLCVSLLFLSPLGSYAILKYRDHQLQSAIFAIYHKQFPDAKRMVAPKMRMSDKLQEAIADVDQNRLLLLLGYLGRSVSTHTNVKLKQINYQGKQLLVELTAPDSATFAQFSDDLTNIGLSVKQQNATLEGQRINATLVLE